MATMEENIQPAWRQQDQKQLARNARPLGESDKKTGVEEKVCLGWSKSTGTAGDGVGKSWQVVLQIRTKIRSSLCSSHCQHLLLRRQSPTHESALTEEEAYRRDPVGLVAESERHC